MAAAVSGRVSPTANICNLVHKAPTLYPTMVVSFDRQIVVIHGDQLPGGLWGTHKPGAHAPGVHPGNGEKVGLGRSRFSLRQYSSRSRDTPDRPPCPAATWPGARGLPFFGVFSLGFSNQASSFELQTGEGIHELLGNSWVVNTPQFQEPISHVL